MKPTKLWRGTHAPLGATWTGDGVNFALFSENATAVELCLFDELGQPEVARFKLRDRSDHVWHGFLPEARPGQLYGYRVHGPYEPGKGHRFNPHKLLLDPYARAIAGEVQWGEEMFGYTLDHPDGDLSFDERDNAVAMPKAVVVDATFAWDGDRRLARPLHESVIYETHVRGFSKLWEAIPEPLRGTYAGLGSPPACEYFKRLGVTAIELLPVHQHVVSKHLLDRGVTDYWGYNSVGFFAPEAKYRRSGREAHGSEVKEFKSMVRSLHAAGLEVILDVVYNHTAEGNERGPTLAFRGIDNAVYYRLVGDQPRYYMDYTGTGNTLQVRHPRVLQLVLDSLRYWVTEMHVDGFRFDLAPALARELHEVNLLSSFFAAIHQDPIVSQVKLIAEPWDVGEGGYHVGNFPVLWAEWNGKYRDAVRRYWKGEQGVTGELASRLSGSPDLYSNPGKTPQAGINFVTAHDGFTLRDLVAFDRKHNEANHEENRDGSDDSHSCNYGHEGLDAPAEIQAVRRRMQRNFLATLLLSQGVPMLRGGDERGATQHGNNNAYCQDNEISWQPWTPEEHADRLEQFTARLIALRREHPIFRQPKFFLARDLFGDGSKDLTWYNSSGHEMTDEEWKNGYAKVLAMKLGGDALDLFTAEYEPICDVTVLIAFNADPNPQDFVLPVTGNGTGRCDDPNRKRAGGARHAYWKQILDTNEETGFPDPERKHQPTEKISLAGRSLAVWVLDGV